jgi:hypothetical protein
MDTARSMTLERSPEYALVPVKVELPLEVVDVEVLLLPPEVTGEPVRLFALESTLLTVPINYGWLEGSRRRRARKARRRHEVSD